MLYHLADEQVRFKLDERTAIFQYDAGLSRDEAAAKRTGRQT